jgi:hypothetical protein
VDSLTLCQVRDALAAWLQAWPLGKRAREQILTHAAQTISYIRNHNAQAKASHRKAMMRNLARHGIDVKNIRTCIGSNFAL